MSAGNAKEERPGGDRGGVAPGEQHLERDIGKRIAVYVIGYLIAGALTVVSFLVSQGTHVWSPSIPIALSALAVAQMGVHLVFFLHLTSGPDNVNNAMALAFGLLIVLLLVLGTLWIMWHLDSRMMPMDQVIQRQR